MSLSSANTGTVRTGVNATVLTVLASIAANVFGFDLDLNDPVVIAAVGIGVPVFYRLSRELADRYPVVGRVLFGIVDAPVYDSTPLPPPPPPEFA